MSTCRLALLSLLFLAACQSDKDGDSATSSDSGTVAANNDGTTEDFEGDAAGECTDGADNDRDGLFDCQDPDCAGHPDCAGGDAGTTGGDMGGSTTDTGTTGGDMGGDMGTGGTTDATATATGSGGTTDATATGTGSGGTTN